jgi:thioredoxin-related protein
MQPWFEPAFNMYTVLEDEVAQDDNQSQPEPKKKKLIQPTLTAMIKGHKPSNSEVNKLKRKYEENAKAKNDTNYHKARRLPSTVMGNLGYVNDKLINQIPPHLNKKEKAKIIERIQESYIDHLRGTYQDFWKRHIEYIKRQNIPESKIELFTRRAAVT